MLILAIIIVIFTEVIGDDDFRIVSLNEGQVKGWKYWNGDYYEFYGVPYGSVPKGRDRYKGPLPPTPWDGIYEANVKDISCTQAFFGNGDDSEFAYGEEECLALNLFIPTIASNDNKLPVVVYIHSGAFALGHGNMAGFKYLLRHNVIVVSMNYRLGALGFLCLGTEDIPGNAGLKDQVAALRWIHKNIDKFDGDPNKVTLAGFSVAAGMAEILSLSKSTEGLIHSLILDSGSALSPWAINVNPIKTAVHVAESLGYNGTTIEELTSFYMNAPADELSIKSLYFYLKNGTFGFSPCIENKYKDIEPILIDSPRNVISKREYVNIPLLIGMADMEGISRVEQIEEWNDDMNKKFSDFLPTDLQFSNEDIQHSVIEEIKKIYFHNEVISNETVEGYVNYFSDSMFTYAIMNSIKIRAKVASSHIYVYEFSYVGDLNAKHMLMDKIEGASHRDQTSYILDFHGWTSKSSDMDMRDRLTMMWANFIKYGNPTAEETMLVNYKWPNYTQKEQKYLSIGKEISIKTHLVEDRYNFWDRIYETYYKNPTAPKPQIYSTTKDTIEKIHNNPNDEL